MFAEGVEVGSKSSGEENSFLRDEGDGGAEVLEANLRDVNSVNAATGLVNT